MKKTSAFSFEDGEYPAQKRVQHCPRSRSSAITPPDTSTAHGFDEHVLRRSESHRYAVASVRGPWSVTVPGERSVPSFALKASVVTGRSAVVSRRWWPSSRPADLDLIGQRAGLSASSKIVDRSERPSRAERDRAPPGRADNASDGRSRADRTDANRDRIGLFCRRRPRFTASAGICADDGTTLPSCTGTIAVRVMVLSPPVCVPR